MKIITFTKNNQFQALLQFSDPANANQAKLVRSPLPAAPTSFGELCANVAPAE